MIQVDLLTNYCDLPVIFSPRGFISSLLFGRTQADMVNLYQGHISDSSIHCSSLHLSVPHSSNKSVCSQVCKRDLSKPILRWFSSPAS